MIGGKYGIGLWVVLLLLFFQETFAGAEKISTISVKHSHLPSALPVVIEVGGLASLTGIPVRKIRLAVYTGTELAQIPFQIDQKDDNGLYVIEEGPGKTKVGNNYLDDNDEIAFMAFDAGEEIKTGAYGDSSIIARIKVEDTDSKNVKWIYILNDEGVEASVEDYIIYDAEGDSVKTDIYALGFSNDTPFLVDELKWAGPVKGEWSENVVDTMKLKQQGKLFGVFDFKRNHRDYTSELIAVKDGPIRVIRRTSNKVRILWTLKSPEVLIDYIIHKSGFQMDIVIDIPFRIGLVFDDLESIATIDWWEMAAEKGFTLRHISTRGEYRIDGKMTDGERQLNEYPDTDMVINSDHGRIEMDMEMTDGSPILKTVFYMDDSAVQDPPENVPGQYGNVGFRTYNWEKLTTATSHMMFNAHIFKNSGSRLAENKITR